MHSRHLAVVPIAPLPRVELVQLRHLLARELKVEDLGVLGDALGCERPRQNAGATLVRVAQRDLRRGALVRRSDALHDGVGAQALGTDRAVRGDQYVPLGAVGAQLALREARVPVASQMGFEREW